MAVRRKIKVRRTAVPLSRFLAQSGASDILEPGEGLVIKGVTNNTQQDTDYLVFGGSWGNLTDSEGNQTNDVGFNPSQVNNVAVFKGYKNTVVDNSVFYKASGGKAVLTKDDGTTELTLSLPSTGITYGDSDIKTYLDNLPTTLPFAGASTPGGKATSAASADVATKVGTATVGGSGVPIYLNKGVPTQCSTLSVGTTGTANASKKLVKSDGSDYSVGSATTPAYISGGVPVACTAYGSATVGTANNIKITKTTSTGTLYPALVDGAGDSKAAYYHESIKVSNSVLYGACWNDFAEYRSQVENILPGYCTTCDKDGKLRLTSSDMQHCEGIVSDTFGFAIGKTDENRTPIAIAGRVLVYAQGDRDSYRPGDCVCAGSDGRVRKMGRDEISYFPDRVVGVVSEIPAYGSWGEGNISVNGRIWIKVK